MGAFLLLLAIVAANAVPMLGAPRAVHGPPPAYGPNVLGAWLATVLLLVALLAIVGSAVRQNKAGVLIDNRNRISLSKLQMIGWTVLILSGVITVSATMVEGLGGAPPELVISPQLLALMGISLGTTAATPALLSLKPDATASRPRDMAARWTDLVRGDDESNAQAPEISKIQQVLITLIVMGVYMARLGDTLGNGGAYTRADGTAADGAIGLPELDNSLVWLIGISHAGYLAYKAVPHTDRDVAAGPAMLVPDAADGAVG